MEWVHAGNTTYKTDNQANSTKPFIDSQLINLLIGTQPFYLDIVLIQPQWTLTDSWTLPILNS